LHAVIFFMAQSELIHVSHFDITLEFGNTVPPKVVSFRPEFPIKDA
jgi:hypothetical protein